MMGGDSILSWQKNISTLFIHAFQTLESKILDNSLFYVSILHTYYAKVSFSVILLICKRLHH